MGAGLFTPLKSSKNRHFAEGHSELPRTLEVRRVKLFLEYVTLEQNRSQSLTLWFFRYFAQFWLFNGCELAVQMCQNRGCYSLATSAVAMVPSDAGCAHF